MFISPNRPIRASIRFLLATVLCLFVFGLLSRRQVEAAEVIFRPPFNEAADGSTYRITSYFDHQLPDYTSDANITIYTGETFPDRNPYHYSGHPGYDFSMNTGTPLYAVADGTAVVDRDEAGTLGRWVCIQHDDGLASIYGHMNTISINAGPVTVGQQIGTSGATGTTGGAHLHFSVVRMSCSNAPHEWSPTDPFGWQGEEPDPLLDFPGVASTAKCLWRSADQDPISCADRVYEDGGTGVIVTGSGWWTEIDGHGYHKFRRINSAGNEIGSWKFDVRTTRPAKVYAWIPTLATTKQARYGIWTAYGWQYVTIDQSVNQDRWRLLGTFVFNPDSINNYVILSANTGEPIGTTWIAVDGIKFRSYANLLPIIINQPPPNPTFTPTPTRTPTPNHTPTHTPTTSQCTVGEPNNSFETAINIPINGYYYYYICPSGDEDWFKFYVTPNGMYRDIDIYLSSLPANYDLELFTPSQLLFRSSTNSGTGDEHIDVNDTDIGGSWRILVKGNGAYNENDSYSIRVTVSDGSLSPPYPAP